MAISNRSKVVLGIVAVLLILAVSAPFIAHALVKNKIDTKLENEFGGLAHYDDIAINWHPLGATLTNLRLGQPNPNAGNQPTVNIPKAVMVLHSVTNRDPHLDSLTAHDVAFNIYVDEKGESSLTKLIREKVPSKRTQPLLIDTLDIDRVTITTYVAPQTATVSAQNSATRTVPTETVRADGSAVVATSSDPSAPPAVGENTTVPANASAQPDSVLKVAHVQAHGFALPVPGKLLGFERWINTTIDSVDAFGTVDMNANPAPALKVGRISFELAQAESDVKPVRVRHFNAEKTECIAAASTTDKTGIKHVATSIQMAFGVRESAAIKASGVHPPTPTGAGLVIEDFQSINSIVEIRGGDAGGKAAYWRLNDAKVQAGNLSFGDDAKVPLQGFLKLSSSTDSSGTPGSITLDVSNLSGRFPQSTFQCSFHIDNVSPAPFSDMANGAQHVRVRSGTLNMDFSGGANDGNLSIAGSVTLSNDFEIYGSGIKSVGVELVRGKPISGVTVDGTLEHPQVHLPNDLALLADIMGTIFNGGPFSIVNATVGKVPVVGPVVKETTKVGSKVLGKIPILGQIFKGGDKNDDKGDNQK